jgi:phosphate transport system substrate-binding protein
MGVRGASVANRTFRVTRALGVALLGLGFMLAGCQPAAGPLPAQRAGSGSPAPGASAAAGQPSSSASGSSSSATACPPAGSASQLTGAGATFPAPLYTRWFEEYARLCNVQINYQAIGSGGGIRQITEKTVDFGASDGIMTAEQKTAAPGILHIPMVAGAVTPAVNLPGIQSGQIHLTGELLASIYLGEITKWDDQRLRAENTGVNLPNQDIIVVRRSDGSGTTNIFTSYLAAVSPGWRDRVGAGNSVSWPVGLGGEGNAGVAGQVRQLPGAIGYVELAYAKQNNMPWVAMKNQAGQYVEPTLQATTAAMEGVQIPPSTEVMIVNSANPQAYPIAGFTWILAYEDQADAARAQALASVLSWALHDGQRVAADLDYGMLSPAAQQAADAQVKRLKVNGRAIVE